jgi:plasmid stabilization system protein ParE
MRRIRIGEPASDEFSAAVRWYQVRRSGLAHEFFDAVAATLSRIETNPEMGATISADGQTHRALVAKLPYLVVYRLRPTEIVIVAIRPPKATAGILEEPKLMVESAQPLHRYRASAVQCAGATSPQRQALNESREAHRFQVWYRSFCHRHRSVALSSANVKLNAA